MNLLVVGSVAYDSVETPFGKADDVLGGSCTYFSISASCFVAPRVVGVVGEDFRVSDEELLRSHGADLAGLERRPGETFRWAGRYEEDGINRTTLYTHLNVFEHFSPTLPESYRNSEAIFLANIHPALQLRVLDQVSAPKLVALDTMDLWINTARAELDEVIGRCQILFVNDSEAVALTDERLMRKAARKLLAMGPETVVIKRGEHGALLFHGDEVHLAPALPLEQVFDPTGAGDTFAGGFLGYLASLERRDMVALRQAMAVGTVMASFVVEDFSVSRLSAATLPDVRERVAGLVGMTRLELPDFGEQGA